MTTTKRLLALLLVLAMTVVWIPMSVSAAETNADGYIEVRTIEDLYAVRNNLSGKYILMNDIDLTEATAMGGDWDFMGNGWNPIGSGNVYGNNAFSGEFNGNGHSIIGMRIDVTTLPAKAGSDIYLGLFGYVTGSVYNLSISGSLTAIFKEKAIHVYAGSVAAHCYSGEVRDCKSDVAVSVRSEDNLTTLKANVYCGGIAGFLAYYSVVSDCVNEGSVFAYVKNKGSKYHAQPFAGGIVGRGDEWSKVERCYNTGSVTASTNTSSAVASGITTGSNCYVTDCYNTGTVSGIASGSDGVANAYGIGGHQATNCYNIGTVSGTSNSYPIVVNYATNCYFPAGSGTDTAGAVPLTKAQMLLQSVYAGFDFTNVWIMDPKAVYPYPQLRSNPQDLNEKAMSVGVASMPAKTTYFVGESLVPDGCMINVTYASGKTELLAVTQEMISGFDPETPGEQTITVTHRGSSDTFLVTVVEKPDVTAVMLAGGPDTDTFLVGTAFDFTGAQLQVSYSDGTQAMVDITVDMTTGGNINRLGKQTVTVTYEGYSFSFEVTVEPVKMVALRLDAAPNKRTYLEGQELDLTGLTLSCVMNNGTENPVTDGYTVSGYDSAVPGEQTVTISYMDLTATFTVTVQAKTVTKLVLQSPPVKTTYVAGEAFDPTGMELVASFDNGTTEVVTDYQITGFDDVPGNKTVLFSYGGKFVSIPILVKPCTITAFEVVTEPVKLTYIQGQPLDLTGMEVQATYNNGVSEMVTDYQLAGYSDRPGTYTVYVTWQGWVDTFTVTVEPMQIISMTVTPPAKLTYAVGEELDLTGMVVMAVYNNGQQLPVEDYTVSGFDSSTSGVKLVSVTADGFVGSFSVVVLGHAVSGQIRSYGEETDEVTVRLLQSGREVASLSTTDSSYRFSGIQSGSYMLEVSKKNHVTRSYQISVAGSDVVQDAKIHLLGDITGDGKVNMGDVAKICAHVRQTNLITDEYLLKVADVVSDTRFNMADVARIFSHVRGSVPMY